jgi:parvulin-like peptidyl-prolyl isomerase
MKKLVSKIRRAKKPQPTPPRVTSQTMAAHREEILGGARKYIYPLSHSKHRLVVVSISLLIAATIFFFSYCLLALYKFKSDSKFLYHVTQVIPFPIARIGSDLVAYENYLFEVNHYAHYYKTQQELDLNSDQGRQQLAEFKKRALNKVITDAYVRDLAKQNKISVSDQEINDEITILRSQNRLGASDKEFESVLKDFWDWSVKDFRRSLKQQILAEKVVSALDKDTHGRADKAHSELKSGKDFSALAKEVSEETTSKQNGGEYGFLVDKTNRDISPVAVEALFKLKPSEYSEVIDVGYGLEIVKNLEIQDSKIRAAHIVFNFKDISNYTNDLKEKNKTRSYINL